MPIGDVAACRICGVYCVPSREIGRLKSQFQKQYTVLVSKVNSRTTLQKQSSNLRLTLAGRKRINLHALYL
jgi:hypothetical protein